jgi:hypothetical protein
MIVEQSVWTAADRWQSRGPGELGPKAHLVLVFGSSTVLADAERFREIRGFYPKASILAGSTAGEICGTDVSDESIVATAIQFEHTRLQTAHAAIESLSDSYQVGEHLAGALDPEGLVHIFVLSDGLRVNGSDLVKGLREHLPPTVGITGGLSGDAGRFQSTKVGLNEPAAEGCVAVIGFYGDRLRVGYGSMGGWDPFGVEWAVTRSNGNVLYELDGRSALGLYKEYLGEHAAGLPASALLFPLSVRPRDSESAVVRTILAVNEDDHSMTFAGDVPVGSYARFMKANLERLVDGAGGAARASNEGLGQDTPDLAILISCVGRKLVLRQRVEEEVEAVREALGARTAMTGFYSYGEICPFSRSQPSELHNQTMTITTLTER